MGTGVQLIFLVITSIGNRQLWVKNILYVIVSIWCHCSGLKIVWEYAFISKTPTEFIGSLFRFFSLIWRIKWKIIREEVNILKSSCFLEKWFHFWMEFNRLFHRTSLWDNLYAILLSFYYFFLVPLQEENFHFESLKLRECYFNGKNGNKGLKNLNWGLIDVLNINFWNEAYVNVECTVSRNNHFLCSQRILWRAHPQGIYCKTVISICSWWI